MLCVLHLFQSELLSLFSQSVHLTDIHENMTGHKRQPIHLQEDMGKSVLFAGMVFSQT